MKKQVKKLKLARETVRNLEGPDLGHAAGGTIETHTCSCTCTYCQSASCEWTCGCQSNRIACKQ